MGVLLTNHVVDHHTQVPNIFIDEYMPHANGSFVKVYLYLLRQIHSNTVDITIETMADMLSNTEADILRALRYWEKQGLLTVSEQEGILTEICLLPLQTPSQKDDSSTEPVSTMDIAATSETASSLEPPAETSAVLPQRHNYSPLQAEALKKDSEIDACLSMVEALLGTTLGDGHMQLVLYLMSDLGFSLDLVITLYETALSRGKSKTAYLEAIALDWAKKGIRTPKEAVEEASAFNGTYKLVANAMGIHRALAPAEKRIIDTWEPYHFSDAIIEEACNRTVLQAGDTNLNYTSKILEEWHKKGVLGLKDIEECDRSYFRQKNSSASPKSKTAPMTKNGFQNFPQRDYTQKDYADLEKQLLNP